MENYQKYLPVSSNSNDWGLSILNIGHNSIKKGESYPYKNHPFQHYFIWNQGRVLDEYQIIYISKGKGYFESSSCPKMNINEGSIVFLFPGEWHRFKPEPETGWDEFWLGCKGNIIDNIEYHKFISKQNPIIEIGISEKVVQLFSEIIENTKQEKMGYQFYISGIALHLLGIIQYKAKQFEQKPGDKTEILISKAQIMFRERMNKNIQIETIAQELHVSYAWFRKSFKNYTGISPKQYLLQLKIEKAKIMLSDSSKTIKEIAFELNFDSVSFFSKQFKEKTALSPEKFRKSTYTGYLQAISKTK